MLPIKVALGLLVLCMHASGSGAATRGLLKRKTRLVK